MAVAATAGSSCLPISDLDHCGPRLEKIAYPCTRSLISVVVFVLVFICKSSLSDDVF